MTDKNTLGVEHAPWPPDLSRAAEALLRKVNAAPEDHGAMNALLQSAMAVGRMAAICPEANGTALAPSGGASTPERGDSCDANAKPSSGQGIYVSREIAAGVTEGIRRAEIVRLLSRELAAPAQPDMDAADMSLIRSAKEVAERNKGGWACMPAGDLGRLAALAAPAQPEAPTMAMLPNSHHPGPRCSCRDCLRDCPDKALAQNSSEGA